jgi:hypothetical protein
MMVYDNDSLYTTPIDNAASRSPLKSVSPRDFIVSQISKLAVLTCKSNVSQEYIQRAIPINSYFFLMYSEMVNEIRVQRQQIGFIIARHQSQDEFYIDVICTKSNGKELMNYFLMYADSVGARSISLSSLPSVLAYYPKFGFKFRKSCNSPVLATLPVSITTLLNHLKSTSTPLPETTKNTDKYEQYLDFMIKLHRKGLAKKKKGPCGYGRIPKSTFLAANCAENGFEMRRCKNNLGEDHIDDSDNSDDSYNSDYSNNSDNEVEDTSHKLQTAGGRRRTSKYIRNKSKKTRKRRHS